MEQIIEKLKATISGLRETDNQNVIQDGVYLYFKGVKPLSRNKDCAVVQIIVAEGSLGAAMAAISNIRGNIREIENAFSGQSIFKKLKAMKNRAYTYVITLEIESYSDVLHNEVLV